MKVLNRPMFRYGGPIKEGIMSGIQEPRRQGYATPPGLVIPNDPNKLIIDRSLNNAEAFMNVGKSYDQDLNNQAFKFPVNKIKKPEIKSTNLSPDVATAGGYGEIEKPYIDYEKIPKYIPDRDGDGISDINPEYTENKNFMNDIFGGPYKQKKNEEFISKSTTRPKSDFLPSAGPLKPGMEGYKVTPDVELSGTDDEPKILNRKEKVNSILEGLGYDRASKNALYDAMIKSGQRISRTGLGAENLVSDVIAETSQSYDKPEKLREAANLMQVQQDLKIDQIKASKEGTGQMNQNYNYFKARGYSDEDSARKAEGLATNLLEAKNKAIDAKLTGNKLTEYVAQQLVGISDAYDNNTYRGTINSKDHKTVSDFARSTDFDGAGVYTVKGRIIELDQNGKILKEEIVTSSTSDKKWWNFGKEE